MGCLGISSGRGEIGSDPELPESALLNMLEGIEGYDGVSPY
jgi:hypothetical protein